MTPSVAADAWTGSKCLAASIAICVFPGWRPRHRGPLGQIRHRTEWACTAKRRAAAEAQRRRAGRPAVLFRDAKAGVRGPARLIAWGGAGRRKTVGRRPCRPEPSDRLIRSASNFRRLNPPLVRETGGLGRLPWSATRQKCNPRNAMRALLKPRRRMRLRFSAFGVEFIVTFRMEPLFDAKIASLAKAYLALIRFACRLRSFVHKPVRASLFCRKTIFPASIGRTQKPQNPNFRRALRRQT